LALDQRAFAHETKTRTSFAGARSYLLIANARHPNHSVNYFAHAYRFLDDGYFVAGTAVPDWLTVVDREVRVRLKHAGAFAEDPDPRIAAVACGLMQHVRDDLCFHQTRAFTELSLELTAVVREVLDGESGMRPGFLGHLLVEVLLDARLIAEDPGRLEAYYGLLDTVDARVVQEAVNRMAPRSTKRLAGMISHFCRERILWDYLEDGKLLVRLNQVMRRVKFAPLPDSFRDVLPDARRRVDRRRAELLEGIPADGSDAYVGGDRWSRPPGRAKGREVNPECPSGLRRNGRSDV